ncbi:MAG: CHY zinc finger protein [Ferruginibacter sp.]
MKNNDLIKTVKGKVVDENTRCTHYHSPLDIIAIKFKCCNEYYPCYYCHLETVNHESKQWSPVEYNTKAILCGACSGEMTISQYMFSNYQCPFCATPFNPNCSRHDHFYFGGS